MFCKLQVIEEPVRHTRANIKEHDGDSLILDCRKKKDENKEKMNEGRKLLDIEKNTWEIETQLFCYFLP